MADVPFLGGSWHDPFEGYPLVYLWHECERFATDKAFEEHDCFLAIACTISS